MQDYDVTLKQLLQRSESLTLRALIGAEITKWLDVELPRVQNLRLDLLGEMVDGGLIHVELQSSNDPAIAIRMAEYSLGIFRLLGRFPRQVVLYVGEPKLRMDAELRGPGVLFQYQVIDIRMLDAGLLLESPEVGDNVLAILARLRDHRKAVHRIVQRIGGLATSERNAALAQLLILAGLRRCAPLVKQEASKMPVYIDYMKNEVLAPLLTQRFQEGELTILRRQLEKRFGELPGWADERLAALDASKLEDLSERVLDARSLEEVLPAARRSRTTARPKSSSRKPRNS